MNVINMVRIQLIQNDMDGLFNLDQDCGCLLNDVFAPCSPCSKLSDYPGPYPDCEEGNEIPCDCGEHDYHVEPIQ